MEEKLRKKPVEWKVKHPSTSSSKKKQVVCCSHSHKLTPINQYQDNKQLFVDMLKLIKKQNTLFSIRTIL